MEGLVVNGFYRYSGRLLMKPVSHMRDSFHHVSREEERAAKKANFYARMLFLAYEICSCDPRKYYDCTKEWKRHGYERIPLEEFEAEEVRDLLRDERHIAIVLRNKQSGGEHPEVLVLVRGTVWTSVEDWEENFSILREGLHNTERVKRTEALVLELVKQYGVENVCLVGHSLGAAVTFVIARKFYLEHKQTVEGHFFNLPFMCVEIFVQQILDVCSIEYVLFKGLMTMLGLKPKFKKVMEEFRRFLTGTDQKTAEEFAQLRGWKPNIYVNPNDRICKAYIPFFEDLKQHDIGNSGVSKFTTIFKMWGLDAMAHHLCPDAKLIISNKGISTWDSHPLKTWVDVEPHRIRYYYYY